MAMSDIDLTKAVEVAAGVLCRSEWRGPNYSERLDAQRVVAAAAPQVEAQVRAQVVAAILDRRIICPVHHMTDCSVLLNGCRIPGLLDEQRAIDATLARGDS